MTIEKMVARYITKTDQVLSEVKHISDSGQHEGEDIKNVIETAKCYLLDAKYYERIGNFEISLASIAYCEGLLDALRLLGVVEFIW